MFSCLSPAFPAKAGIQMIESHLCVRVWVPACAGNADVGVLSRSYSRHCEAQSAEATQGVINLGSCQSTGLLRCARNDAVR